MKGHLAMKMAHLAALAALIAMTACATVPAAPPDAQAEDDGISIGMLVDRMVYGCSSDADDLQCSTEARQELSRFEEADLLAYRAIIPEVPNVLGDPATFDDDRERAAIDVALHQKEIDGRQLSE